MSKLIDEAFALAHLSKWIPSFKDLLVKNTSIERMTGITNQTFRFSHVQDNIQPKDVIFRVFGKTCEGTFINRNDETIVYNAAAQAGLGPKMLGYDKEVRAEEFLYSRVLRQSEMNEQLYRRQVALQLAEFHQIQIQELSKAPLLKEVLQDTKMIEIVEAKISNKELFTEEEILLIAEMRKVWFSKEERNNLLTFFPSGEQEQKQILFCHNDLLANNVLILASNQDIRFIDFEYSHYNLRAFDIANYFNESQYDYSIQQEPYFAISTKPILKEDYKDFIEHYLLGFQLSKQKISIDTNRLSASNDKNYFNELLQLIDAQQFQQEVESILEQELLLATCLSHFYWGVWALHMSKDPTIQFDYVKFAYSRFTKYEETKKQLIQQKQNV